MDGKDHAVSLGYTPEQEAFTEALFELLERLRTADQALLEDGIRDAYQDLLEKFREMAEFQ
jgi:hypothetical protein